MRKTWLVATPEERVRQFFLTVLVDHYRYTIEQIAEEQSVVGRGAGQARADFVLWRSPQEKLDQKPPLIVVECKSDNVTINPRDYHQGENYARLANAPFFVTHNTRSTRYWRVRTDRMPGYIEEIENVPAASASEKEVTELLSRLKVFREDEFADLLHQCHNVIRNREHLDPAAAFDEIAKILFLKTTIERRLRAGRAAKNLFTADFLDEQRAIHADPVNVLFLQTKEDYRADGIFASDDRVNLRFNTAREIVRLLERYNLSDTSEDVKGIAFERFLGRTFRGEIGQFFTPRSIVEFMVRMVDLREGQVICDPASGSGGFLIRAFEILREQILADIDRQYRAYVDTLATRRLSAPQRARLLRAKFDELQRTVDPGRKGSRLWTLANRSIFGCDANERMARTSKMNMIMHGDGHGGVHHRNGFLGINGIFDGRFHVVLTNPPFGSTVEQTDHITDSDVAESEELVRHYNALYGTPYRRSRARLRAARGKSIASLFELSERTHAGVRTEILFLERCLQLLRPGGRLGIVLPEGVINNPSLAYVREFCEDRAYLDAIISLPPDTFKSSGADVRASLVFLRKYTQEEKTRYDQVMEAARSSVEKEYRAEITRETQRLTHEIESARSARDSVGRHQARQTLHEYARRMEETKRSGSRSGLKQRLTYPVFLYEAEHVGITATGEPDANELYPDESNPAGLRATCLELYRTFASERASATSATQVRGAALVVPWHELHAWDTKSARAAAFRLSNPQFQPLGTFVEEVTELVRPWEEPDKTWLVYGVNNRDGVFLNGKVRGANFKAPYKRIRKDWFFHNPTRANVGSLGRVPDVPDEALTSPEYQVWRIRGGLLPEFVEALLNTRFFLDLVDFHRVGAVKERLFTQNLIDIPIPVVDEPDQKQIAATWQRAQEQVARARVELEAVRKKISDAFYNLTSAEGRAIATRQHRQHVAVEEDA